MKDNTKTTDEQVDKLQKQNEYLKKRNSSLSRRNKDVENAIQDLRTQLRAESRVNDKLKDILFGVSKGQIDYYSLGIFIRWVNEIALDNEKLREEKKMLHPFKLITTSHVKIWIAEN